MHRKIIWLVLLGGAARFAQAQVVLRVVQVPAGTPPTDTLYVAGSFNGWNPRNAAFALRRQADGSHAVALPADAAPAEYKFTRGSWATAEADSKLQPLVNRRLAPGQSGTLDHVVQAWASPATAAPRKSTASPRVHVLAQALPMPQLGRTRRVLVYLPADYAQKTTRRYPVLYLHDGQNVFDAATSYSGEWGVDETLDRLAASQQDRTGCIVVAVDNGGAARGDEYIPWRNEKLKMGGQGDEYVDFLAQTLKPYVDARYRTRPGAAHTGVAGSSLGGLISVYAALKHPQVFGRVGAFSPAFWVCNDSLLAYAARHRPAPTTRFYFLCGPKESETMLPLTVLWRNKLRAGGVPPNNLVLKAPADGEHKEWFWEREFPAAYQWLFSNSTPIGEKKGGSTKARSIKR